MDEVLRRRPGTLYANDGRHRSAPLKDTLWAVLAEVVVNAVADVERASQLYQEGD